MTGLGLGISVPTRSISWSRLAASRQSLAFVEVKRNNPVRINAICHEFDEFAFGRVKYARMLFEKSIDPS